MLPPFFFVSITTAFVTGLFGSLHCLGMCGPLISLASSVGRGRSGLLRPLLYVSGKLISYLVLGLLAGWLGHTLTSLGRVKTVTAIAGVAGGSVMLLVLALSRRGASGGISTFFVRLASGVTRFAHKTHRGAPLFLGLGSALLPCGLLYAMVARSAVSSGIAESTAIMAAFGLGTSPALMGLGSLVARLPLRWNRWAGVAGEIIVGVTAVVLIWRGVAGWLGGDAGPSCCPR